MPCPPSAETERGVFSGAQVTRANGALHLDGACLLNAVAAGVYALDCNVARLTKDHAHARWLAEGLTEILRAPIDLSRVQSNIVFFAIKGMTASEARARWEARGVRSSGSSERIRAVTHRDVSAADIDHAVAAA